MYLFNKQLNNEKDWEKAIQSTEVFLPLIEHIIGMEKILFTDIENLLNGTNAVFKVGKYILKIYAPPESNVKQVLPQTEVFATNRAIQLGVAVPKVIAHGCVGDKYKFNYLITEYKESLEIMELSDEERIEIGRKLRKITDKLNTQCEPFNDIDVMNDRSRACCWDRYPESLKKERLAYIRSYDYGENVFVHGDLCGDNLLLTPNNELYIIDFADALLAPKVFEHALLAIESGLDAMILRGYFEKETTDEFIEMCLSGILLHNDFEIVHDIFENPDEYNTLGDLRKAIYHIILRDIKYLS